MKDIQKWLLRARGANQKIDALDEMIARLRSRSEGGGEKSGGGGSGKGCGLEKYICSIEMYEAEREKAEKIRDEVFDAICQLADTRYQAALIAFYITGREWQDIAEDMFCDRRTITRWHGRALLELERKKVFEKCLTMSHDVP